MTSASSRELEEYGLARVRDIAFDAVRSLWRTRQAAGVTQRELAEKIGRDPGWISRQLSGPGNWTFRSFGALVEALDGEVEIIVHAIEDPIIDSNGYDAYEDGRRSVNLIDGGRINSEKSTAFNRTPTETFHYKVTMDNPIKQDTSAICAKRLEVLEDA